MPIFRPAQSARRAGPRHHRTWRWRARAGPYAQVIAELPVVLVMPALRSRPGIGRYLVADPPGPRRLFRYQVLHAGGDIVVRDGGRILCKHRIGLEGQVVQGQRSEEHTSELKSLMSISYAVFCLKKKKT